MWGGVPQMAVETSTSIPPSPAHGNSRWPLRSRNSALIGTRWERRKTPTGQLTPTSCSQVRSIGSGYRTDVPAKRLNAMATAYLSSERSTIGAISRARPPRRPIFRRSSSWDTGCGPRQRPNRVACPFAFRCGGQTCLLTPLSMKRLCPYSRLRSGTKGSMTAGSVLLKRSHAVIGSIVASLLLSATSLLPAL